MVRKNMIISYNRGNLTIYDFKGGANHFLCAFQVGANHFLYAFQGGPILFLHIFQGGEKIFNGLFLCLATYMSHYHWILPNLFMSLVGVTIVDLLLIESNLQ